MAFQLNELHTTIQPLTNLAKGWFNIPNFTSLLIIVVSLTLSTYRRSAFFLSLIAIILFTGCENETPTNSAIDKKQTNIEQAKNVAANYTQGGKLRAHLTAPLMLRVQDTFPYIEFPKTLHVDFYNNDSTIESRLDAQYAKYTESKSIVFLRDSVKVISTNGDTLLAPQLYWDRSRIGKEFYTTAAVIVKTKTQIIYGQKGMEISQDLKTKSFYEITNSVFRVPASQFPE